MVVAQQINLPVLYSYYSFFVRDVHREFGLINVHSFHTLPAISSGKSVIFSVWRVAGVDICICVCRRQ